MLARRNNRGLARNGGVTPTGVEKMINDFFGASPFGDPLAQQAWSPWSIFDDDFSALNIARHPVRSSKEDDGTYVYQFDVPGLDKEDLNVTYDNETLTITSKQEQNDESKYGKHELQYQVSAPGLDTESIEATCEKGVLTVKAKEAGDQNQIQIEVK